jgi:hypothetical protein
VIVDLCKHQRCELSFGKGIIFVERLAEGGESAQGFDIGRCRKRAWMVKGSYICPIDPATSVHRVSMSSFKVCRAKTLSSGSSSDRKPSTPEAEVKPGMVDILYLAVGAHRLEVSAKRICAGRDGDGMGGWMDGWMVVLSVDLSSLSPARHSYVT